jgi:hypothetical protein
MTSQIEQMRRQIHATALPEARAVSWWRRSRRTSAVFGGAIGLLLAATALVVLLVTGGSNAPAAYAAVFSLSGGQRTITITLREQQAIPALNARLAAENTRIRVAPVLRSCDDPVHSVSNGMVVTGPAKTLLAAPTYLNGHASATVSQTVLVNTIAGRTFVIPASHTGLYSGGSVVVGPAPRCFGIGPRFNVTS